MTQSATRSPSRTVRIKPLRPSAAPAVWEPLVKQTVVAALVVGASVASALVPFLLVTNETALWGGSALVVFLFLVSGLMVRWPALRRLEIAVPIADFVAIGMLRFGTGESQSVFLAIVVLPVIWIAAGRERWRIVVPLLGVCLTLLLPLALAPGRGLTPSELVRLVIAVLVYATVGAVVNELSRRSLNRLTAAQLRRRIAEREVSQAAAVQRSLQPLNASALPPQFAVTGACVPARTVGGDFFDWYATPSGGAAVTLGDVMGKGVGAGMIAAAVRTVIRSSIDADDPAAAFQRAAQGLSTGSPGESTDQFTTCFHARIDADGLLRWADAGHGLTLLRRAGGEATFLRSTHLPIGLGVSWSSDAVRLAPGDSVIAVSDGVLDLFGGSLDSIERYRQFIVERADIEAIVDDVIVRAAETEQEDDVTVLALTWGSTPAP